MRRLRTSLGMFGVAIGVSTLAASLVLSTWAGQRSAIASDPGSADRVSRRDEDQTPREADGQTAEIRPAHFSRRSDWPAPLLELVADRLMISRQRQVSSDTGVAIAVQVDGPRELGALAIALIELHHNEESFALLLEYGLRDLDRTYVYERERAERKADCAVPALQFLRSYDPTEEVRAAAEEHLVLSHGQVEKAADIPAAWAARQAEFLDALLRSWDFAQGLSQPRRKAYQEYERRRWMALALVPPPHSPDDKIDRFAEASALCPWPDGDEDFFLRNFESPASTEEDVRLAGVEAFLQPDGTRRFSDEGIRRLEAVAKGDSFRAKEAARLLPLLKNEKQP